MSIEENYNKEVRVRGVEFNPSGDFKSDIGVLAELLKIFEADFVLIPDNPLGKPNISSLVSATLLGSTLGIECVPTISGSGKSLQNVQSLILGAKYASLSGIACVGGDGSENGVSALEILNLAESFEYRICTVNDLERKVKSGANYAITQPLFSKEEILLQEQNKRIKVLPNFMPIFSHSTFSKIAKNSQILGFEIPQIYQDSSSLFEENQKLLGFLMEKDFYLTLLNPKAQIPYLRKILRA